MNGITVMQNMIRTACVEVRSAAIEVQKHQAVHGQIQSMLAKEKLTGTCLGPRTVHYSQSHCWVVKFQIVLGRLTAVVPEAVPSGPL